MISRIFMSFLLIVMFNVPAFSQADTVFVLDHNTRDYDQKHIKLDLKFSFEEGKVIGKEEFTFSPLKDGFDRLILHCRSTEVSSVKLADQNLTFWQDDDLLHISFNESLSKNNTVSITINYVSYPSHGMYFFYPTEEIPGMPYQIWTQGQGTNNRHWFPAYDLPDDKLTKEVILTVPEQYITVSNGVLASEENNNDGTKTWHWKTDFPYANYLTTVIVGEYFTVSENVRGTLLEYNMPPDWKDNVEFTYGRTPQMLNFLSDYIVPYPYERYAQTSVQDFLHGGMENVTATTLNRRIHHTYSAEPNYSPDDLIAHELAHMWFGDYLTCATFEHIWLNEGFATYFTDLWIEDEFGWDAFLLKRYQQCNDYFTDVNKNPLSKYKPRIHEKIPSELDGGKAYDRGAAILNMLRFILGDETFNKGIKHYVSSHRDDNVVTEDFKDAMETVSGKNLNDFFNQWVYMAGFPEFKISYNWDADTKKVLLTVEQAQEELPAVGIFKTPVLVEVTAGKDVVVDTIWVSKQKEIFKIDAASKPEMVLFNKYLWILCKTDFSKSLEELSYQLQYDDDITGRIFAAQQLVKYGTTAIPVLTRTVARDQFYAVRQEAVESLKKIASENSFKGIALAADDPDGRVRETAVKALSIFSKEKVEEILLRKFKEEDNDYVRGAALYSLGTVKADNAFDILSEGLKMDSHRNIIRRGAFDGFKNLGDPDVLPFIKEYTQYKYSYGGMHLLDISALDCALAFDSTNHDEVVEAAAAALLNPYFRTRNKAAGMLADLNAVSKLPLLESILAKERRIVVRPSLEGAIKRLKGSN